MRTNESISKTLFAHGGVYTSARFTERVLAIVLIPLYARFLADEGYGIISLLTAITPFLSLAFAHGLHPAWFRLRHDQKTPEEVKRFETTLVWHLLFISTAGIIFLSLAGKPLAKLVTPGVPFFPLVFLTIISAAGLVFSTLYERKMQAEQKPFAVAIFSIMRTAALLATIILLVAGLKLGPFGKVLAEAFISVGFAIVAIALIRPGGLSHFSRPILKHSLNYGLPLVPHSLIAQLNNMAGRVLINHYIGLAATGVYSMGHVIANVNAFVATAFNQAYAPLFIRYVQESEQLQQEGDDAQANWLRRHVAKAGLLMVTTAVCSGLCLAAGARELLLLLATEAFDDSWTVVVPLVAATIANASYLAFAQSLLFSPRGTRRMPVVTTVSTLVNIAANIVLLPRIGFLGSAWALFLANTTMAAAAFFIGRKILSLPHPRRRWIGVYLSTVAGLALIYSCDYWLDSVLIRLGAKIMLLGISSWTALRCTGVGVGEIYSFVRRKES